MDGEFEALGSAYRNLCKLTHSDRMKRIYDSIENPDFSGDDSTITMLNILFDIFEHTFIGMINYKPDFYTGDLVALIPDEELETLYPAMISDTDWNEFVLGNLTRYTIHGDHNSCISDDRIEQIVEHIV